MAGVPAPLPGRAHFQRTLAAQASYEKYGRKSKREHFLDEMNEVVPWSRLLALVESHYPKAGNGRRPGHIIGPLPDKTGPAGRGFRADPVSAVA